MSAPDIGRIGEQHVVNWLKSKGYIIIEWDTKAPGATDIEAQHESAHILVQVKSALYPNEPASLSSDEIEKIRSRASKKGAQPWEARVQLEHMPKTDQYALKRDISWRKL